MASKMMSPTCPTEIAGRSVSPSVSFTPNALRVKLTLGETDLPAISVGQVGLIIFDAIQDVAYPLKITSIGLAPDTTQGVVTYTALAELTRLNEGGDDVRPAPGMNGAAARANGEESKGLVGPRQTN